MPATTKPMKPYRRRYATRKHPNPKQPKIVRPNTTGFCIFCNAKLARCQRICCSSPECRKKRDASYKGYYKHRTLSSQLSDDEYSITTTHGQTYTVKCKCPNCGHRYEKQLPYQQPCHKDGVIIEQRIYCERCDDRRSHTDDNTIYFMNIR